MHEKHLTGQARGAVIVLQEEQDQIIRPLGRFLVERPVLKIISYSNRTGVNSPLRATAAWLQLKV